MKKGKAEEALELASILEEIKVGDQVKFAPGHQLDGTLGVVAQINPDGTFSVKVGKALQPPVEQGMLIKLDGTQPAAVAQTVSAAPDATPTA